MLILIVFSLAVWRMSSLFAYEKGPYDMFLKMRKATQEYRFLNLSCFMCISVIVSLFFALWIPTGDYLINALAISAGSILVDKYISND